MGRRKALVALTAALMFQNSLAQTIFNIPLIKNQDFPTVIPGGEAIGIKLYTKGLLVVEAASFEDEQGNIVSPAAAAGIRRSDVVISVNNEPLTDNSQLAEAAQKGDVSLKILRNSSEQTVNITPVTSKDGSRKIGLWVRDSAAGIGTLTFTRTDNNKFAALGHGIIDCDVKSTYLIKNGSIQKARVISVVKGKKGNPGELKGIFDDEPGFDGTIEKNDSDGIYGRLNAVNSENSVEIASKWEVGEGPAQIICSVDEVKKAYDIEIESVAPLNTFNSKSMVIRVTDKELLEKTGGIVQGMSGSPIMQNGKLVGAVTHVFVNEPEKGYGIFVEEMLSKTEQ